MSLQSPTFPSELAAYTRIGLTRGVTLSSPMPASFGEAEARYREERRAAESAARRRRADARRRNSNDRRRNSNDRSRRGVSRWTTWLPSVPLRHSSPAPQSSNACRI
jgi:hypothetical protein